MTSPPAVVDRLFALHDGMLQFRNVLGARTPRFRPSMCGVHSPSARDLGVQNPINEAIALTSMDLHRTFDAAISSGGVWVTIDTGQEFLLGTHLFDYDHEVAGMKNVSTHLERDGLLLLSIQEMHHDLELMLPEGVVYSQRVSVPKKAGDHFMIEKQYSFRRGCEVLADQTLSLGFYRRRAMDRILDEAGFDLEGIDDDGQFVVYSNGREPAKADT